MAGVARLAIARGHTVTGADQALYPPMSTQLESMGIETIDGYDPAQLEPRPDLIIIGNALTRGNPVIEQILEHDLPYVSGPEWLERDVLPGRHVIAVAGTHGKTSVTSLVSWMLEGAGLNPGFLIGGVSENFGVSARLGDSKYFVIEADEYDTAFFDKRSKFVHYHPRTLIINNLEFDHADIFRDLEAIKTQFHHLVRTLPGSARIIKPHGNAAIDETLQRGCWSEIQTVGTETDADWQFIWQDGTERTIEVRPADGESASGTTPLMGLHNAWNVTTAVAAVSHAGVSPARALSALSTFKNVRRRLELRGEVAGIRVYDDFAHHPTAIAATIDALRGSRAGGRIIALIEPRSNTMVMGVHQNTLGPSLGKADQVAILVPEQLRWDIREAMAGNPDIRIFADTESLIKHTMTIAREGDHILVMSNGGFDSVHERLLEALRAR